MAASCHYIKVIDASTRKTQPGYFPLHDMCQHEHKCISVPIQTFAISPEDLKSDILMLRPAMAACMMLPIAS